MRKKTVILTLPVSRKERRLLDHTAGAHFLALSSWLRYAAMTFKGLPLVERDDPRREYIHLRLDQDLHRRLRRAAKPHRLTVEAFIRAAGIATARAEEAEAERA